MANAFSPDRFDVFTCPTELSADTLACQFYPNEKKGKGLGKVDNFVLEGFINFVHIPPGHRRVEEISRDIGCDYEFMMSDTHITQSQWVAIMGANPSAVKGPDIPVTNVNFYHVALFCNRLSQLSGRPCIYREKDMKTPITKYLDGVDIWIEKDLMKLPLAERPVRVPESEEWFWAALGAGDSLQFLIDNAVLDRQEIDRVKTFQPNGFGLYDVIGNAWVWTQTVSNEN